jgi:hypothetical protein
MRQWEYCRIVWKATQISDMDRRELQDQGLEHLIAEGGDAATCGFLNMLGSSEEAQEIVSLADSVAALGRDGWELVTHSQVTSPTTAEVFHFKREISTS